MAKLQLKFSHEVQGEFAVKSINLLLTFQVNCPGCFLYALPPAQDLFERYSGDGLNVVALSTAFEDFELNTLENTSLLINEKRLVGETKKALAQYGFIEYPKRLDFPILMDELVPSVEFLDNQRLDEMVNANPQFANASEIQRDEIKSEIRGYLSSFEKIPYTFTVNAFGGTPTWVIFDENYYVLAQWFGHKSLQEIEWTLKQFKK